MNKVAIAFAPVSSGRPAPNTLPFALLLVLLAQPLSAAPKLANLVFDAIPLSHVDQTTALADLPKVAVKASLGPAPMEDTEWSDHMAFGQGAGAPFFALRAAATPRDDTRYLNAIASQVERGGPYDPHLNEHLLSLARLQQARGEHEAALETLARAEHNSRINFGLYAPELFEPVRLAIASHLALGDYQSALERQEYLIHLHQRAYGRDNAAVVPELTALGDMYFAAFERGIGGVVAQKDLKLSAEDAAYFLNPNKLTLTELSFFWLGRAQHLFLRSIQTLLDLQQYDDPQLPTIEKRLIATLFMQANRRKLEADSDFFLSAHEPGMRDTVRMDEQYKRAPSYKGGVEAFTRILAYRLNDPAAQAEDVARAMLELGDWHLLFGHRKRGEAEYARAREFLMEQQWDEERIDAFLNPPVPVQLPTFASHPHSLHERGLRSGAHLDFDGYIDVAFRVNANGRAEDIEILGTSDNADRRVRDRLLKVLTNAPYRPPLRASNADKVRLRYQFAWL